jgi:hypothetical protein
LTSAIGGFGLQQQAAFGVECCLRSDIAIAIFRVNVFRGSVSLHINQAVDVEVFK